MKSIMKNSRDLENRLWKFASMRFAMNLLSQKKPYDRLAAKRIQTMAFWPVTIIYPDDKGNIDLKGKIGILVTGKATSNRWG